MDKGLIESRRIWAAILAVLSAIFPVVSGWIGLPPDFLGGLDSVVQAIFAVAAAVLALLSKFRPDPPPAP
jgi:hypothetical protein